MKISWNWLLEFLPTKIEVNKAAEILTDIGLETEGIYLYQSIKGGLEGLIVGEVMHVEKHPDADKLKITGVDIGTGELLKIVCGAPNVEKGQKVIVAQAGSTVYPVKGEPFTLRKAKIRGIESNGMLCAEDEIGLGENHEGLFILDANAVTGTEVKKLFNIYHDTILEIGLTANHADAFSHYGVARELYAALVSRSIEKEIFLNRNMLNSEIKINAGKNRIKVIVENTEACLRYSGILIQNITVKESPQWLKNKLLSVGVRPVNNIVDVTNYVLQEIGQPMHAFDADKIKSKTIRIQTLPADTKFITLDAKERKLSANDLMICDDEHPVCIAGIYGGLNSGITEQTKNVFLESACFNSLWIRKSENFHQLKTDASSHFGKGTDAELTVIALKRSVELLQQITEIEFISDVIDIYPVKISPFEIFLRYHRLELFSVVKIPSEKIKHIITSLNIKIIADKPDGLLLHVPSYKNDVTREIDIIEEILRMYGYNNIPVPQFVKTPFSLSPKPDKEKIISETGKYLCAQGFYEIFTNSITKSKYVNTWMPAEKNKTVKLLNSLNAELDCMRQTLLFSGLEMIQYNVNRKQNDLKLFEFGKQFETINGQYIETPVLSFFVTGNKAEENWNEQPNPVDIFFIKQIIHKMLKKLNVQVDISNATNDILHGVEINANNKIIGIYGEVKTEICNSIDIKQPVFYAELKWEALLAASAKNKIEFAEIPKYPEVRRDIAIILEQVITYEQVKNIAHKEGKNILRDVILFDVYQGEKLKGKKSYAVGLIFRDDEKTLTDVEVDAVIQKLMQRYEKELNAIIRKQ